MQAQELLQNKPSQSRDNIPLHLQIKEEEKAKNKKTLDDALLANPIEQDLVNKKQQSTAEFLNMTLTPPKRDIVEMMTPSKEGKSTAITPYKGQQSTLDFLIEGTPQKTPQQLKVEKQIARIKELKNHQK